MLLLLKMYRPADGTIILDLCKWLHNQSSLCCHSSELATDVETSCEVSSLVLSTPPLSCSVITRFKPPHTTSYPKRRLQSFCSAMFVIDRQALHGVLTVCWCGSVTFDVSPGSTSALSMLRIRTEQVEDAVQMIGTFSRKLDLNQNSPVVFANLTDTFPAVVRRPCPVCVRMGSRAAGSFVTSQRQAIEGQRYVKHGDGNVHTGATDSCKLAGGKIRVSAPELARR